MIYIFEGMDNCLKDTIINKLRSQLPATTHVLKYSSPPLIESKENYQREHFKDMFSLIEANINVNRNLILNRAHLGEYVYGPLYRNYDANWIFDVESQFIERIKEKSSKVFLALLYDSNNQNLKKRDDGKSLSNVTDNNIDAERLRFLEAFDKSYIFQKVKFNLSDYLDDPNAGKINASHIFKKLLYSFKIV